MTSPTDAFVRMCDPFGNDRHPTLSRYAEFLEEFPGVTPREIVWAMAMRTMIEASLPTGLRMMATLASGDDLVGTYARGTLETSPSVPPGKFLGDDLRRPNEYLLADPQWGDLVPRSASREWRGPVQSLWEDLDRLLAFTADIAPPKIVIAVHGDAEMYEHVDIPPPTAPVFPIGFDLCDLFLQSGSMDIHSDDWPGIGSHLPPGLRPYPPDPIALRNAIDICDRFYAEHAPYGLVVVSLVPTSATSV